MKRSKNQNEIVGKIASQANLMTGNGQIYRRSPLPVSSQPQSYETFGTASSSSFASSTNDDSTADNSSNNLVLFDDDVNDLSQKFEQLQRQVQVLTDTQTNQDERYKRSKQENDNLLLKIHNLEDQLRELELSSEQRTKEDDKRFREQMAKQMKIHSHECEQHLHSNFLLQQDLFKLQKDLLKSDANIKTLKIEKEKLEQQLEEKNHELVAMDEELHKLKLVVRHLKEEESVKSNLICILNEELESSSTSLDNNNTNGARSHQQCSISGGTTCSGPSQTTKNNTRRLNQVYNHNNHRNKYEDQSNQNSPSDNNFTNNISNSARVIEELESSLSVVKQENKALKEANEDLQAQLLNLQLEEGRSLIQEGNKSFSLADEICDIDVGQLMKALKEHQEENARLRKYIDDILLKIVEKNPELLDRTAASSTNRSSTKKAAASIAALTNP